MLVVMKRGRRFGRWKKKTAEIAAGYVTVLGNPSYWWIGP
jgi:hypothetical protein